MYDASEWLRDIARAAARLCDLGALEGAAGNISLFLPVATAGLDSLLRDWSSTHAFGDYATPRLPEGVVIVTGTGRRLRDIDSCPDGVLCAVEFASNGMRTVHRAPGHGVEPTSEIDSHLGIHAAVLGGTPSVHAVIHAQPPKLTFLSHSAAYRDERRMNRQLLRWQPETIVVLPEGLRVLPFETPGTARQGRLTADASRTHRLVIWAKHGVVSRSHGGPSAAADLIDYAEAAAGYEVIDLQTGRQADGLSLDELRGITARFGVSSALLDQLPEDLLR